MLVTNKAKVLHVPSYVHPKKEFFGTLLVIQKKTDNFRLAMN